VGVGVTVSLKDIMKVALVDQVSPAAVEDWP
jgi:hypothetical protein